MSDTYDDDEEGGAAEGPVLLPPRENPDLVGQDAAEATLLASFNSGRLPHAWLIAGPAGVGKATLAFRFARFLFAETGAAGGLFAAKPASLALAPDHPAFRRVASGGHPDLLVIERGIDPRRKRKRTEIVVDDARTITGFLRLTPSEGGWRIVIVDEADALNRSAANSLLKILEEPPARAILILVSDNPGRLLPTIRSRCRRLMLKPLGEDAVRTALGRYRPDLSGDDATALARLSAGSIGRALSLAAGDGLATYRGLSALLAKLPELEPNALIQFADRAARFGGEETFALVGELLPGWLARMVALAGGGGTEAVLPGEDSVMRRLAARRGLDHWVRVWEGLTRLFADADNVNLDKKQVVLEAFFALEAAAR